MRMSWTLSIYLGRQFLNGVGIVFGGCIALIFLVDVVELLRRAASRDALPLETILGMALLKLPNVAENALPFAFLFGAIWTFVRLTRSNELVVARASGVSAWEFMMPAVGLAFLIGVFMVTVYNPLSAALVGRYEQLEDRYLRGETSLLSVQSTGFWLRQGAAEGPSVIHARRVVHVDGKSVRLEDVFVILYAHNDAFRGRIDAESATLVQGAWLLERARLTRTAIAPIDYPVYRLPTDLTPTQIRESFASPQTLSFWQLPRFIELARAAGFSALSHRLHWHEILATPVLLCAMVILAATFSLRLTRLGGVPQLAATGIMSGFLLYFLSDLSGALGISGLIPVFLAAWTPTLVALLLGLAMLFYLEDG